MKIHPFMAAVAALLLLVASPRTEALVVYCVSSSAQLESALMAADLLDDTADIRLRAGTYTTSGTRFLLSTRASFIRTISGGWTGASGQCTSQVFDPAQTRLDGGGTTPVLVIQQQGSSTDAAVFVSNLTIANGFASNGNAGCVHVNLQAGAPLVQFDRTIIRDCRHGGVLGRAGAMRLQLGTGGTIRIRNSLLAGNQATGAGAIGVYTTHPSARIELNNNTIAANTASDAAGAGGVERLQSPASGGVLEMRNNAVVGNSAGGVPADLYFSGLASDHVLVNNAVQGFNGISANATGTVSADPTTFRAFGTDFRLRPGSALRNAGAPATIAQSGNQDLDFLARVQQGAIDIGAYEDDGVFASSFESP